MLRVAFVGATPAVVPRDRQRRREGPVYSRGGNLAGGGNGDGLHEIAIARRTEADIVGEHRRTVDIRMAMDRIRTPEDGHGVVRARACPYGVVVGVGERAPVIDARVLVAARETAATVQNRSQGEIRSVRRRGIGDLRLDHLADLLFDAQAPQVLLDKALDASFGRVCRIEPSGARSPWRSYFTHRCLHLVGVGRRRTNANTLRCR